MLRLVSTALRVDEQRYALALTSAACSGRLLAVAEPQRFEDIRIVHSRLRLADDDAAAACAHALRILPSNREQLSWRDWRLVFRFESKDRGDARRLGFYVRRKTNLEDEDDA